MRTKLELIGAGLALLVIVVLLLVVRHYHTQSIDNGFRADSLAAVNDTTVKIGDTWMRRALQGAIVQDSLEKALAAKPKVIVSTVIQFDTMFVKDAGKVIVASDPKDSIRTAHFEEYSPPIRSVVDVMLPRAGGHAQMGLLTVVDPIQLDVHLECGVAMGGIAPASVQVTTRTPGVRVGLPNLQAEREVCNPKASLVLSGWKLPGWTTPAAAGLGLLAGLLIHH